MKLMHVRRFSGRHFISVTHYAHKDALANKLADAIRKETGARVRVVHDATGFTHVFVELTKEQVAQNVAMRGEFN